MEDKSLIKKYENFLKLNHLELSSTSAKDFIDLEEGPSLMELSMEYVKKGTQMQSKTTKVKYFQNALKVNPENFAAKVTMVEALGYDLDKYKNILNEEYERLLKSEYLDPKYYINGIVDFSKYQETFNYLRGLRSYFITLIAKEHFDIAINIGQEILELNPTDHFHVKSSLCFLYLRAHDTISAISLFKKDDNLIPGTKELTSSFAAYLNQDSKKSKEYLSDLEAVNPYLYRLVTGEITIDLPMGLETLYSDSLYVYLGLVTIGSDLKKYESIIEESRQEHPILESLTKDELDVLKVMIFDNSLYFDTILIKKAAKKFHLVDYVSTYSDGRMDSILLALTSRGIIKNGQITIYGRMVRNCLEDYLIDESNRLKDEALKLFESNEDTKGLELLLNAMDYAPHDYFLKKIYLFHKKPFDYHYARSIIHEMGMIYKDFESFKSYSTISSRQKLEEAMDEIHYEYYKEAYKEKGIKGLIEAYQFLENQFNKYTNLVQMAQYLNKDELPDDDKHLFYNLYKEYKEKGIISYDSVVKVLLKSKLEYSDFKRKTNRIPYGIIDVKFEKFYLDILNDIMIDEILTSNELDVINLIHEGGKPLDEAKITYSYLLNSFNLEKAFFIKSKNKKQDSYELYEFVLEFLKNV